MADEPRRADGKVDWAPCYIWPECWTPPRAKLWKWKWPFLTFLGQLQVLWVQWEERRLPRPARPSGRWQWKKPSRWRGISLNNSFEDCRRLVSQGAGGRHQCKFMTGDIVQHVDKGSPAVWPMPWNHHQPCSRTPRLQENNRVGKGIFLLLWSVKECGKRRSLVKLDKHELDSQRWNFHGEDCNWYQIKGWRLIMMTNTSFSSQITSWNRQSPTPCRTKRMFCGWLTRSFVSSSWELENWGSFTLISGRTLNASCFRRWAESLRFKRWGPRLLWLPFDGMVKWFSRPTGISTYLPSSPYDDVLFHCARVYWLLTEWNDV